MLDGAGGTPLGGPGRGGHYYHASPIRRAMPGYNYLTNLLEIQMKDTLLAIAIGITMCALLLHWLDALFP